jgi:hypothetical protein
MTDERSQLLAAWHSKLPNVEPTDRELSAFALGIEWQAARAAPAQDVTATEWNEMRDAMENCRLYAARHRKEEWAQTILDFCKEAGVTGSPLRAAPAQGAVVVSVEPITGPNYEAGLWSRRNWEAALEDQRAAPAQPVDHYWDREQMKYLPSYAAPAQHDDWCATQTPIQPGAILERGPCNCSKKRKKA